MPGRRARSASPHDTRHPQMSHARKRTKLCRNNGIVLVSERQPITDHKKNHIKLRSEVKPSASDFGTVDDDGLQRTRTGTATDAEGRSCNRLDLKQDSYGWARLGR
ncbi:hypothetical protein EVAR_48674_1 [Eumeta japonica]|uniref:Uncharacterized protein n=1 Tax=Eumeta variegata TaxID=151549 RepID=A0A4C1XC37_EUMVA|nr:hypothetical protein EVAR_48674_1 [Eumeta japonica]